MRIHDLIIDGCSEFYEVRAEKNHFIFSMIFLQCCRNRGACSWDSGFGTKPTSR